MNMSIFARRILAYAIPLLVSLSATTVMAQIQRMKPDTSCPRYNIAANLKKLVAANQGAIEPIHIPDGLAVLATANTAAGVKAIQAAAKSYMRDMQKAVPAGGSQCASVMKAVNAGQIKEAVTTTEKGVLITLITRDKNLKTVLQQGNCCDYCICPSTVTRCSGCC
jgi:hypothetical protein